MKRAVTIGVAVVALALLGALGVAEVVADTNSMPASLMLWPGMTSSNTPVIFYAGSNAPLSVFPPAQRPPAQAQLFAPSARHRNRAPSGNPPPGVYKTAPYSCIVVVPGLHPDDRCIVNPGESDSSMPILKPDLQFIPLHPPQK